MSYSLEMLGDTKECFRHGNDFDLEVRYLVSESGQGHLSFTLSSISYSQSQHIMADMARRSQLKNNKGNGCVKIFWHSIRPLGRPVRMPVRIIGMARLFLYRFFLFSGFYDLEILVYSIDIDGIYSIEAPSAILLPIDSCQQPRFHTLVRSAFASQRHSHILSLNLN